MSIKTGTRQLKLQPGAKVDSRTRKGMRTLRCKRCGNQAIERPDGKGGTQLQCPNCKSVYTCTQM